MAEFVAYFECRVDNALAMSAVRARGDLIKAQDKGISCPWANASRLIEGAPKGLSDDEKVQYVIGLAKKGRRKCSVCALYPTQWDVTVSYR